MRRPAGRGAALVVAMCACALSALLAPAAGANTLIQQGPKITPSDESDPSAFGYSVALSADGNTALIGGPVDGGSGKSSSKKGAVWVYTRTGSTWSEQQKLTVENEMGREFGTRVALSADGDTALIGGGSPEEDVAGAAWVFTRSGTTWTEQAKLAAPSDATGNSDFGASVALSSDGNTALIGGPRDNTYTGAAWIYTRSAGVWSEKEKLLATKESEQADFGASVALAGDASTALIGDGAVTKPKGSTGNAWVFTQSAGSWKQQGSELSGGEESGNGGFGESVALSETGNTALIGGRADDESRGAAWVFTRAGDEWKQLGPKLTGGDEIEKSVFGYSVALDPGGTTALIGGVNDDEVKGAAWVFTDDAGTWSEREKLVGEEEAKGEVTFGQAVALSAEGATALIGGSADHENMGAAWAFTATSETPSGGGGHEGSEKKQEGGSQREAQKPLESPFPPPEEVLTSLGSPQTPAADIASTARALEEVVLSCTRAPLVLSDALIEGTHVLLAGSAARSLHGRTVEIVFAGKHVVARARVAADGLFTATAPLPPSEIRGTNGARYEAEYGRLHSLNLKLTRRLLLQPPRVSAHTVTLVGEVVPPLTAPATPIAVEQELRCGHSQVVGYAKPGTSGRFRITLTVPRTARAGIYRLTSSVLAAAGSTQGFATYSLPLPAVF